MEWPKLTFEISRCTIAVMKNVLFIFYVNSNHLEGAIHLGVLPAVQQLHTVETNVRLSLHVQQNSKKSSTCACTTENLCTHSPRACSQSCLLMKRYHSKYKAFTLEICSTNLRPGHSQETCV